MSEHDNLAEQREQLQLTPDQEAEYLLRFGDIDPHNLTDVSAEHLSEFLVWLRAVTAEREGSNPFTDIDFGNLNDVLPERLQAFADWCERKGPK